MWMEYTFDLTDLIGIQRSSQHSTVNDYIRLERKHREVGVDESGYDTLLSTSTRDLGLQYRLKDPYSFHSYYPAKEILVPFELTGMTRTGSELATFRTRIRRSTSQFASIRVLSFFFIQLYLCCH